MTATIALRPYLPADAERLADLFRASIEDLAAEDYGEGQRAAWMEQSDDLDAFGAKLAGALTLVALIEGEAAGFASLKGGDQIDMLYVDPDCARMGVASALIDALEKIAGARGAKSLTVDASDTARPFFGGRGFVATSRKIAPLGDEWLANTAMTKTLAGDAEPKGSLQ